MSYDDFKYAAEDKGWTVSEPLDLGIDIKNRWNISSSWVKVEGSGQTWYQDYRTGKQSWDKPLTAAEREKVGKNTLMAFDSHDIIALRDSIKKFEDDKDFKDEIVKEFEELIMEKTANIAEFAQSKKDAQTALVDAKAKFEKASQSWSPFKESQGSADKRFAQMKKGIEMYAKGVNIATEQKKDLVKEMNQKVKLAQAAHHNNVKTAWKTASKLSLKQNSPREVSAVFGGRRRRTRRKTKKRRRKRRRTKKRGRKRRRTKKRRRRRRR